jgi:hypothetical protein
MSGYASVKTLLGLATYSVATASRGFDCGEYRDGALVIHVRSWAATSRAYVSWQMSADATGPGSGRFAVVRSLATALKTATGLSIMTLPSMLVGKWCRAQLTLGGTSPSVKLSVAAVLKSL